MDYLPNNPLAVVRSISDTTTRGPVRGGLRALGSLSAARGPLRALGSRLWRARDHPRLTPIVLRRRGTRDRDRRTRARASSARPSTFAVRSCTTSTSCDASSRRAPIFVEELSEVPDGAVVVLAAHGVSPEVRRQAAARDEPQRDRRDLPASRQGPHRGASLRRAGLQPRAYRPRRTRRGRGYLRRGARANPGRRVHRRGRTARLRSEPTRLPTSRKRRSPPTRRPRSSGRFEARYPDIAAPRSNDICYATQNRQDAVRSIAHRCDLMIVVGSANSSNTARLVEVAEREGCRAELIEDATRACSWAGWPACAASASRRAPRRPTDSFTRSSRRSRSLGPVHLSEEKHRARDGSFRSSD